MNGHAFTLCATRLRSASKRGTTHCLSFVLPSVTIASDAPGQRVATRRYGINENGRIEIDSTSS
jgi:hypothetical protein